MNDLPIEPDQLSRFVALVAKFAALLTKFVYHVNKLVDLVTLHSYSHARV